MRMLRRAVSGILLLSTMWGAASAQASPPDPPLTAKQAERDLRILERGLRDLHPGLFRYQSAESLVERFSAARAAVADGSSVGRMYLLVASLAASVRCGHTWTNPLNQSAEVRALLEGQPALPFDVSWAQGRLAVRASADPAVPAGSEVLEVDGRTPAQLIDALMPYLRADGSSDGKRLSQLDTSEDGGALDRLLPLLFAPKQGRYRIRFLAPDGAARDTTVAGMSLVERRAQLGALVSSREAWRFEIDGEVARMTLPTFAFWNDGFDWQGFLDRAFQTLQARGIRALVLDLRENEGGDSAIGEALLGYLISQPYRMPQGRTVFAYERAPYDLVRFLDTWDYGFFDRTDQVVKAEDGTWRPVSSESRKRVEPVARFGFRGRVVLLTGPRMSSAGFLFARDAQASGAATLIGQPTGGNLRGLNGGQLAWMTLPNSGVAVDIPLMATVYDDAPDASVRPDVPVKTRLEDLNAGRDPDWEAALDWLHSTSAIGTSRAKDAGAGEGAGPQHQGGSTSVRSAQERTSAAAD